MTAINAAAIFFIGLDRFFKAVAFKNQTGEFNLLGEIIKFGYQSNYYVAFSLPLAGKFLTGLIAIIILGLILYYSVCLKKFQTGRMAALSLIIIGAGSNLFDRLKYGFVIDYLDLKYFTVFNLADAMITVGVFLLLLELNKKRPLKAAVF